MPSHYLSSLMLVTAFLALTAPLAFPHFCPDPWAEFMRWLNQVKRERLAKRSALIEQRMKKYWVIDMRKLR